MSDDILLFYDDAMKAHDPGPYHPERPDRLGAIEKRLRARPVPGTRWRKPSPAPREALERVHARFYLDALDALEDETARLDPDTSVSPGSIPAMYLAAGAALDAVEAVAAGEAAGAFVLPRPPGHHAERDRARGFCLVNNIAVAAAHATARLGFERVLVVDWDVHHGNGTQSAFYARSDVLLFSHHRYPFFPGSGWIDEVGRGAGEGYTVNLPYPPGFGDAEHLLGFHALLEPIADAYRPDLVIVSAGFDAHVADPLGGMRVTTEGYAALCGFVRELAQRYADGRLVLVLEGGYDLDALADSVHACVQILAGATPPSVSTPPNPRGVDVVRAVMDRQQRYWPL